jgi:hypothetical protein
LRLLTRVDRWMECRRSVRWRDSCQGLHWWNRRWIDPRASADMPWINPSKIHKWSLILWWRIWIFLMMILAWRMKAQINFKYQKPAKIINRHRQRIAHNR